MAERENESERVQKMKSDSNMSSKFPNGWEIGSVCVMITNKKKKYTQEYTVKGYDGRYFTLQDKHNNFHHASISRMFKSRDDALAALQHNLDGEQR